MVAAYEVGTTTSKFRPVASFNASAMICPPEVITFASTEGTNSTLIGCSSEPISGRVQQLARGVVGWAHPSVEVLRWRGASVGELRYPPSGVLQVRMLQEQRSNHNSWEWEQFLHVHVKFSR
jgi:hypothetical protein